MNITRQSNVYLHISDGYWKINSGYINTSARTFSVALPMYLFCLNMGGTPDSLCSVKFKYMTISQSTNPSQPYTKHYVRDFIPVIRNSDNEVCLYDRITQTFFTNQGTGNFIAGPTKS